MLHAYLYQSNRMKYNYNVKILIVRIQSKNYIEAIKLLWYNAVALLSLVFL